MNEKPCVLLAEDNTDDIFLVQLAVHRAGLSWSINAVRDGEQAIEYLQGTPPYNNRVDYPLPELLLLDLKMPKLNGFDVLAWLRGRPDLGNVRIVILSSSSIDGDVQMAFKLGAREFLTKPHAFEELVHLMAQVNERWQTQAQTREPGSFETDFVVAREKASAWGDGTCWLEQNEPRSQD
jgi:CheY-like chemotaxis protein